MYVIYVNVVIETDYTKMQLKIAIKYCNYVNMENHNYMHSTNNCISLEFCIDLF